MTREEIIQMAREAGMSFNQSLEELNTPFCDGVHCEEFERFAVLVAAAEREACAKVSLRPPQPAIFLSENISHAQFMAQFEEGDQA